MTDEEMFVDVNDEEDDDEHDVLLKEELIAFVKANPALYAKNWKEYAGKNFCKDLTWKSIGYSLSKQISGKDAAKMWYNIRQRFGRERRKVIAAHKGKSGQETKPLYVPKWSLYSHCLFLADHIMPRKTASNYMPHKNMKKTTTVGQTSFSPVFILPSSSSSSPLTPRSTSSPYVSSPQVLFLQAPSSQAPWSQTLSPQALSAQVVSPKTPSSQALSPQALSPQTPSSQAPWSQTLSPQALSAQVVSPKTPSSQALSPQTPSSQAASSQTPSPQTPSLQALSPQAASPQTPSPQTPSLQALSPQAALPQTPSPQTVFFSPSSVWSNDLESTCSNDAASVSSIEDSKREEAIIHASTSSPSSLNVKECFASVTALSPSEEVLKVMQKVPIKRTVPEPDRFAKRKKKEDDSFMQAIANQSAVLTNFATKLEESLVTRPSVMVTKSDQCISQANVSTASSALSVDDPVLVAIGYALKSVPEEKRLECMCEVLNVIKSKYLQR